jgi:chemotaxis methyl-accepting protein methylase/signal transduction histidine kinase/chemotaxis response regulator CheB
MHPHSQQIDHTDILPTSPAVSEPRDTESENRLFIVGIGASAGGLEALERLFKATPPNTGAAFVVIQHLSPDFKSLMDELLARHTRMRIYRVEDGMAVEPNCIYLMPPKKEMIISGGRLLLTDKDPGQDLRLPIDHFFRSLAHDAGRRGVAIVLSGTGSDGSRGIRDVHEAGGLVIAQSEETAKFDGMPKSARDTGIVDCVLTPEQMPRAIIDYQQFAVCDDRSSDGSSASAPIRGVDAIFSLLRNDYGIDFSHYKPNTVARRIERRLSLNHAIDLDDYVERLRTDTAELNSLYRDLLIGVTRFFRDREAFEQLERRVIPQLLADKHAHDELRVWVAGCATGEEAYSLAILLHEQVQLLGRPVQVKIFATDVHRASLEIAGAGVYNEDSLSELTSARLQRYFVKKSDGYQVVSDLRQMIVFAQHNLIKDAPFTKLDLITCRNLLIYLQPLAQKKVLSLFHFALKTGGMLFLGPSESPGELAAEFDSVDEHWKFYRKRRDIRLPADLRLPLSLAPAHVRLAAPAHNAGNFDAPLLAAYDRLLEEYMPPGLLVTDRRQLVHAFGSAGQFLRYRDGRPTTDILDLLDGDLKLVLAGALQRAAKDQAPVVYRGVRVRTAKGDEVLTVAIKPIFNRHSNLTHLFISLESAGNVPATSKLPTEIDVDIASREHVSSLESELRYTRENLQATIEELETSNEELQASNEELVASNEELQSTNEELHSVNEELYTVNAEYQKKISELTEMTDDMDNLLRSTDIGTIFLDRNLCIRKFTPQIGRAFDLLPHDIGRRIDSFSHNICHPDLLHDVATVLTDGRPIEKDVQDRQGNWYFLRLLPYRSHSTIEGVVLSLIDISKRKSDEESIVRYATELETANRELQESLARQRQAEEDARGAVQLRDQFLAILSHELRNPLAAVLNASLLLECEDLDEKSLREACGAIGRQSQQMARLLDDLLDVSRITRNKIEIRKRVVDLCQTTRDAIEAVRPSLDRRDVVLKVELPDEPVWVFGDPARLQQIQANLLTNAIKFTPSAGKVVLNIARDGGEAVLRIRDTGVGVPPSMRERIFDLFVQLDGALGRSDGGMGVGLTLVRALVLLHDGKVSVESEGEGKGSEFIVRLPLDISGERPQQSKAAIKDLAGLRLALVEDQPDIRIVTARLLEAFGCTVLSIEDGRKAAEAIEQFNPDAALIDIGLPHIDGYEVARRVRMLPGGQKIRLIAVTGFGQKSDRQKALEAGFDAHLVKPVDLQDLARVLNCFERDLPDRSQVSATTKDRAAI